MSNNPSADQPKRCAHVDKKGRVCGAVPDSWGDHVASYGHRAQFVEPSSAVKSGDPSLTAANTAWANTSDNPAHRPPSREEGGQLRRLCALIEEFDQKLVTPYGEQEGGFIRAYIVPTGGWHRILAAAREPRYVFNSCDYAGMSDESREALHQLVNAAGDRVAHAQPDLRPILTELLRLYDWRKELGKMEADHADRRNRGEAVPYAEEQQLIKWLRQYGREKKAAWDGARAALSGEQ